MAMRDLVNGGAACDVPSSSSSSNPLGALTNVLLGSSSKTQQTTAYELNALSRECAEQQLLDCDHEYTLKAGGLMKEADYPYTGRDHSFCKFDKSMIAARVSNFSVVSADEDQIAANLVQHGPLAIAINAMWMQTYMGGVSCPFVCSKSQDHGVLLVGFGSSGYSPIRRKEMP